MSTFSRLGWLVIVSVAFGCSGGPAFDAPSNKVVEQLGAQAVRALQVGPVTLLSLVEAGSEIERGTLPSAAR